MAVIKFVIAFYVVQFINRSTSTLLDDTHGRRQITTDTLMHTFPTEAQGHKVSAGASALWFLLSKGCKMEMRLNGWHGVSLPAACIIESCSNTFDSTWWRPILARCSSPLTFFYRLIHPLPAASLPDPASYGPDIPRCFIFSPFPPTVLSLCISSSHQISCSHFSFLTSDPFCLRLLCFYPWRRLRLQFSTAHGNLIRPIKKLAAKLLIVRCWGACQVL